MPIPPNIKLKRSFFHDYREPFIYLVTVTVADRKQILCKVEGSVEQPKVVLTEVGKAVKREIFAIEKRYPQVRVIFNVIMPDHVHIILRVLEQLPEHLPLGNIVAAWKQACGKAYSALLVKQTFHGLKAVGRGTYGDLKAAHSDRQEASLTSSTASFSSQQTTPPSYQPLFSKGFNDSILTGKHQLQHMLAYVKDNPRRLLIKRQCRELFAIRRGILVAGTKFDAVGNIALLQKQLMAVHCRRKWSDAEQKDYAEQCISAAEKGVVLVGAFISKEEKAIEQTAMERHLPIIRLVENGFDELFKPIGQDFDFCAEGQLLLLAPWPYHSKNRKITREQCRLLNEMAEMIAMN
jgi:REP element-mobilizing transposase RayT